MSIEAEIDDTVTAFVKALVALVRELALASVREALAEPAVPEHATHRRVGAARARPAPHARIRVEPARDAPVQPLPPPPSPVVVQRVPAKKRRRAAAHVAPPATVVAASPPEPIPAKNWVVVRRPAREALLGAPGARASLAAPRDAADARPEPSAPAAPASPPSVET